MVLYMTLYGGKYEADLSGNSRDKSLYTVNAPNEHSDQISYNILFELWTSTEGRLTSPCKVKNSK